MIEIRGLKKTYYPKKQPQVNALVGIDLELEETGMTFLLGKSGSGKSTLLNLLGGLDGYTEGEIVINGKSSKNFSQEDFDNYRNNYVGFIFQEYNLLEDFLVGKNLSLALELQGKTASEEDIEAALSAVGLSGYSKRKVSELSGGQQQRVAVARALIKKPKIIFADEPTGNLDSKTGDMLFELLKEISKETLVVVVTHDKNKAQKFADRIVYFADGKIVDDRRLADKPSRKKTEESAAVKSRLTFKSAVAISLNNLKLRKLRLIATLFLLCFAFAMFSASVALSRFDAIKASRKVMQDNGIDTVALTLAVDNYVYIDKNEDIPYRDKMTFEECERFASQLDNSARYTFARYENTVDHFIKNNRNPAFYNGFVYGTSGLIELGETEKLSTFGLSIYDGRLPQKSNEIAISLYTAEVLKYTAEKGAIQLINSVNEAIGKYIYEDGTYFEIVGIIDTGLDMEKYQSLTYFANGLSSEEARQRKILKIQFENEVVRSLHCALFVNESYFLDTKYYSNIVGINNSTIHISSDVTALNGVSGSQTKDTLPLSDSALENIDFFERNKSELTSDELVISKELFLKKYSLVTYREIYEVLHKSEEERTEYFASKNFEQYFKFANIRYQSTETKQTETALFKLAGISNDGCNYVNGKVLDELKTEAYYKSIIVKLDGSDEGYDNFLKTLFFNDQFDDYVLEMSSVAGQELQRRCVVSELTKKFGLYASLIFGFFAVLMLLNYFTVTIMDKKHDIGILRALGASGKSVFLIYLVETAAVAFFSFLLAIPITLLICFGYDQLNNINVISTVNYSIFNLYPLTFVAALAVGLATAFVGSFVPVLNISKKKPVDVIRG